MKNNQRLAAKQFSQYWKDKGYEKGQSQPFWLSLLRDVFDIEHPESYITFEDQVPHIDHTSFIDGYIEKTKVLIEQKSSDKNLYKAIKQSDGSILNPFQQAKRYIAELPVSKHPKYVVTCNFKKFCVYDMEQPNGEPQEILLENLEKEYYRLSFLVDTANPHLQREMEVSIKAGEIVGLIYDALLEQYIDKKSEKTLKSLNILIVRLVFCLYAEDANIFGKHDMFLDYLKNIEPDKIRKALIDLFEVLNTKYEDRDPYLEKDLVQFPYVNGGLFENVDIEIPNFTQEIKELLLTNASADFDWSQISPTIFGAIFESTLNPETRRTGGMHYTSIENIHKVIDSLFLDDLNNEFETILQIKQRTTKNKKLEEFQTKLSQLTFLDSACGSGNFLTETYISLRTLENKILAEIYGKQKLIGAITNPVKVSIKQFYGIEINDFAVTVAKTALWIAESQMLKKTEDIVHTNIDFLPLKTYANIIEANALRIKWEDIISKEKLNYIMGNPPFIGARLMSQNQKDDMLNVFGDKWENIGNIDYVSCWYYKAAELMQNTNIKTALVSTNSITQGEQVAILFKPLYEKFNIHIDFAHRTFRWDSQSNSKAHVYCVIVGFSCNQNNKSKILYSNDRKQKVNNINAYLFDADNIFIESCQNPICEVPKIGIGNKPIDDGNYLFTTEEMNEFIKKEPISKPYFKHWYGAEEFINNKKRYCLWLGNCLPDELRKMSNCLHRIENVKNFRLKSKSAGTRKLAERPTRFHVENMPDSEYIIIPRVSSEKRKYIPIGFLKPENLCGDSVHIIPNATLYHFGILTSNVHMAWTRTVCGRLEMRYRYSKDIVYNNFPWCNPTKEQKEKIEQTAQMILDARAKYPNSSLADLYDELTMPSDLRTAHQKNDIAVMEAYGFKWRTMTESDCVSELMKMYQELTNNDQ